MNFTLPFLMVILSLGIAACGGEDTGRVDSVPSPNSVSPGPNTSNVQSPVPAPSIQKDGNFNGRGKVTKINMNPGSVEIDHEEIVGFMKPMTMEFSVKDRSMLNGLAAGDEVEFVLEYKHPAVTIVGIKKIQ